MGSTQASPKLNIDSTAADQLCDLTVRKYTSDISKYDDTTRQALEIKADGDYPRSKIRRKWRRSAEYLDHEHERPPPLREPPNSDREKYIRAHTVLPFDGFVHGRVWDVRVGKVVTWIEPVTVSPLPAGKTITQYWSCIAKVHPTGRLLTKPVCSLWGHTPWGQRPLLADTVHTAKVLRQTSAEGSRITGDYEPGDMLQGAAVSGHLYGVDPYCSIP
jgi:hypothetical protein